MTTYDFKYIFFGTPEFAEIVLSKLIEVDMLPAAVVCNPDKPVGRKQIIIFPPTKVLASKYNIKVYQPGKIDEGFLEILKSENADFYVVAAYSKILPNELLNIPPLGVIGVHPSLLPQLRGASPIQSAILKGLKETGVTLYLMDEKMDHGPIFKNTEYKIQDRTTYEELSRDLAELAGNLLIETLPEFIKKKIKPESQNESEATYTKKFNTDDGYVNIDDLKNAIQGSGNAEMVDRKIRALNPDPGVYTLVDNKRTKLLKAKLKLSTSDVDNLGLVLVLEEIQFEGKKPMQLSQYRKPLF